MKCGRASVLCGLVVCCAAASLFPGLSWGLPDRSSDRFLFGGRTPWTGQQIVALAGGWESSPERGADVAFNPLTERDRVLVINQTDSARAAIIRRYRLFSYQPDEMITLRALAGMQPSHLRLDPRLYQYGGLWIYPVGLFLQVAARLGLVSIRPDVAWYLDHPEAFGRMYVVARFYSALWGLVGVAAIFWIVLRISGRPSAAAVAALCFAWMPVVVNGAHEAKPHLGGAALMLLATVAAAKYAEAGRRRAWIAAGILCGAATGMVPTAYPVFLTLPLMVLLRRSIENGAESDVSRTVVARRGGAFGWAPLKVVAFSGLLGFAIYVVTNPYLFINWFLNRKVLESNLGNSAGMYHAAATSSGLSNAIFLVAAGTSPLLAILGTIGTIVLLLRAWRRRGLGSTAEIRRRTTGLLLAAPAALVGIQFVALAGGKPAEYGRFAILPDAFLLVEAAVAVATFIRRPAIRGVVLGLILLTTAGDGAAYLLGFLHDSERVTGRLRLAEKIERLRESGQKSLAVEAEPAPYCLPPVDLFRWEIRLAPRGYPPSHLKELADVAIRAVDSRQIHKWTQLAQTPISWADKPFELSGPSSRPSDSPDQ